MSDHKSDLENYSTFDATDESSVEEKAVENSTVEMLEKEGE
jgi:hypothetical protein